MRLKVLEEGLPFMTRMIVKIIRRWFGAALGPVVIQTYMRNCGGQELAETCEIAMRKATAWQTWEVELFAAFVSKLNACRF